MAAGKLFHVVGAAMRKYGKRVVQTQFQFEQRSIMFTRKISMSLMCQNLDQTSNFPGVSKMADTDIQLSQYTIPNEAAVCLLDCKKAFEALTNQEKLYAHHLSRADWYGSLICLLQTSPESPGIFAILMKIFRGHSVSDLVAKAKEQTDVTDEEIKAFLIYSAAFLANMGNYKSFGDTKFVPGLCKTKLDKMMRGWLSGCSDGEACIQLWETLLPRIFSLKPRERLLGLADKGITTYFSLNCTSQDAELAQEFLNAKDLSGYNTRLFKYREGLNEFVYEIRLASVLTNADGDSSFGSLLGEHLFVPKGSDKSIKFIVTRGDYSPLMAFMVDELTKAKGFASNETEVQMLNKYAESFTTGSIDAHKDGSRFWIKNKGPIIELYIGFIESYRDPFGVRGEFEGFVAMVDKEMSAVFGELVSKAEHFLPLLPWPASYEKDEFQRPDFTSLVVLSFGSSGIPAGINIPNYDDIRQTEGFKNVSLGNVLSAGYKDSKVTFLDAKEVELYSKLKIAAFEVQVGLHELLGHGSGKLFQKDSEGKFNFDIDNVLHLETGTKVTSWYEHGETWTSKFQAMAASYEECRAECVGIYLCLSSEILSVFGHKDSSADDIIYVNWLNMVRAGLLALEFYSPESRTWGQAHMQARFVILRVLLEAGENLVTLQRTTGEDKQPDIILRLDRSKINTVGKTAIGNFLRRLQLYKATGDYNEGKGMYDHYSDVNDHDAPHFLSLRHIVLARKQPRKMFVQCNTVRNDDGAVSLIQYEESPAGLIQSFVDRFKNDPQIDDVVLQLAQKDVKHFELCDDSN